jgi:hypothetical protein
MDRPGPEYLPAAGQIPPFVTNDDELRRFEWCFAIGRLVCARDDAAFVRELFHSEMPTTDTEPHVTGDQLELTDL